MINYEIEQLLDLYVTNSKHSNYQILPSRLRSVINATDLLKIKSRYEAERLRYILDNVNVEDSYVLDIGGNTGYFTFEMLENKARKVYYYEGNSAHAEFVKIASKILELEDKIEIHNCYFDFGAAKELERRYDITLLLNVLHHIGDDYGDTSMTMKEAKELMIEQLNCLAGITEVLILQLGFNWKGDRTKCLFEKGTKEEMTSFVSEGTRNRWVIDKIGVAESQNGMIKYCDLNAGNCKRNDELGEFLNRPIFIMKAKKSFAKRQP